MQLDLFGFDLSEAQCLSSCRSQMRVPLAIICDDSLEFREARLFIECGELLPRYRERRSGTLPGVFFVGQRDDGEICLGSGPR